VTGNASSIYSACGNADVDGGETTLQSPVFDLTGLYEPVISYWRRYSNDLGYAPRTDSWRTYISEDGSIYIPLESTDVPDHEWRRVAFRVHDYFPSARKIYIRFAAEDGGPDGIVEAAIDDVELYSTGVATFTGENAGGPALNIFPNPASSYVNIDLSGEYSNSQVTIVDDNGKEVYSVFSQGKFNAVVDIRKLPGGIYFIVIRSDSKVISRTLNVIR
jgi:hypothetical protein